MPQAMASAAASRSASASTTCGTLAAALERHALHVRFAGVAQHELADFRRAREAHHVDIAMERERLARLLAESGHDVEHARRQACLGTELGDADGGERAIARRA